MRISDLDFILVPEWLAGPTSAEPDGDHWISRWERNFATAAWLDSHSGPMASRLIAHAGNAARPVVLVTHGSGVELLLDAGPELAQSPVIGAFIVAPVRPHSLSEGPRPLDIPSVVVAPDDHPECSPGDARELADCLGGHFVAAGAVGRLDARSGHGPWPEGLMRLGWFLKQLQTH